MFNLSLSKGNFPRQWERANVIPAIKKSDREVILNYRPIPLTSMTWKILKIIRREFICTNHGFRKKKSFVTNLLDVSERERLSYKGMGGWTEHSWTGRRLLILSPVEDWWSYMSRLGSEEGYINELTATQLGGNDVSGEPSQGGPGWEVTALKALLLFIYCM